MTPNKHQLGVVIAALLLLPSGAAAYSASFDGGAGTSYETGSGLVVTSGIDHGLDGTNPFNGSDTVYLDGVSISASGPASVTVDQFRGTRTQLSGIDATSTAITVDPDDKSAVEISGGITGLSWEDAALDNSNQITFSADSAGTITATDLPNETDWTAATPDGVLVDSGTTTASGEAQISVDAATDEELILFTDQAPQVTNPSPSGNLSSSPPTLSLDVDDPTFGTAQGDSLTVKWFVDGEQVGTSSLDSAGTATYTLSGLSGGDHTWHATVTDSYGVSTTSTTQSISTPSQITIRDETKPSKILDNASLNVSARLFSGELVFARNATDGTVDLAGLPTGRPFILSVSADDYYRRTIVLESIYEQSSVYLLPKSETAVYQEFSLSDQTGEFAADPDTALYIEAAINTTDSGGLKWVTITGDRFGAGSTFKTYLAQGDRYRLRISDGEHTRVLGSYIATRETTTQLSIGQIEWSAGSGSGATYNARYQNGQIRISYNDSANATTRLELTAIDTAENETIYSSTTTNVNSRVVYVPVQNTSAEDRYRVLIQAERSEGEDVNATLLASRPIETQSTGADPTWLSFAIQLSLLAFAGFVAGTHPKRGGLPIVAMAFGATWFGLITIPMPALGLAGAVALASASRGRGF